MAEPQGIGAGAYFDTALKSLFVGRNPFRVEIHFSFKPKVVARRQPWAKCWNPRGVRGAMSGCAQWGGPISFFGIRSRQATITRVDRCDAGSVIFNLFKIRLISVSASGLRLNQDGHQKVGCAHGAKMSAARRLQIEMKRRGSGPWAIQSSSGGVLAESVEGK
jgi:hypothetical protein